MLLFVLFVGDYALLLTVSVRCSVLFLHLYIGIPGRRTPLVYSLLSLVTSAHLSCITGMHK